MLESNIATGASSIQPSDFRRIQNEDVGLSGNEDNIEEFVPMSTQIPIDLDFEAQMDSPMCTRSTTQIPSKKGKRSRPHAESQEAISLAMKDMVVALVNFCESRSKIKEVNWCKVHISYMLINAEIADFDLKAPNLA